MVNLSLLGAEVSCVSRKCPSCGSEKTTPWMGGTAAGRSRTLYHCEHCGYFGPIFSDTASSRRVELGF